MEGLVGYGSSSEDECDAVQNGQTSIEKNVNNSTHGITPTTSKLFPEPPKEFENLAKPLDISDDEDNYVPVKKTTPTISRRLAPGVSNTETPPLNLSKIINDAQIVSVSAENLKTDKGMISSLLPKPKNSSVHELELENLHKSKRRKKDKRKIFAFDLNDYLEEDQKEPEKEKPKRPVSAKSASGLFSILPEPRNCKIGSKSTRTAITERAMLRPRTLKPKTDSPQTSAVDDVEETEEKDSEDFFAFGRSENVSKEIANAAKTVKLDVFKPKQVSATPEVFKVNENLRSIDSITVPLDQEFAENSSTNNCSNEDLAQVPLEFRDIAFNNSEIIDVNQEITSTDEWALRNLDYSDDTPTSSGKCPVKGQSKRKNQIGFLAWQAKERESELKKQWANNKMNRHATQSKYGFR